MSQKYNRVSAVANLSHAIVNTGSANSQAQLFAAFVVTLGSVDLIQAAIKSEYEIFVPALSAALVKKDAHQSDIDAPTKSQPYNSYSKAFARAIAKLGYKATITGKSISVIDKDADKAAADKAAAEKAAADKAAAEKERANNPKAPSELQDFVIGRLNKLLDKTNTLGKTIGMSEAEILALFGDVLKGQAISAYSAAGFTQDVITSRIAS